MADMFTEVGIAGICVDITDTICGIPRYKIDYRIIMEKAQELGLPLLEYDGDPADLDADDIEDIINDYQMQLDHTPGFMEGGLRGLLADIITSVTSVPISPFSDDDGGEYLYYVYKAPWEYEKSTYPEADLTEEKVKAAIKDTLESIIKPLED